MFIYFIFIKSNNLCLSCSSACMSDHITCKLVNSDLTQILTGEIGRTKRMFSCVVFKKYLVSRQS